METVFCVFVFLGLYLSAATAAPTGDRPSGGDMEKRLPGSSVWLREAVERADVVITGEVVSMRGGEPGAPDQIYYSCAIKVRRAIRGDAKGEVTVDVTVRTLPKEKAETAPEKGKEYVFFVVKKPVKGQLEAIKVLRATSENLVAVEAMLGGAGEKP